MKIHVLVILIALNSLFLFSIDFQYENTDISQMEKVQTNYDSYNGFQYFFVKNRDSLDVIGGFLIVVLTCIAIRIYLQTLKTMQKELILLGSSKKLDHFEKQILNYKNENYKVSFNWKEKVLIEPKEFLLSPYSEILLYIKKQESYMKWIKGEITFNIFSKQPEFELYASIIELHKNIAIYHSGILDLLQQIYNDKTLNNESKKYLLKLFYETHCISYMYATQILNDILLELYMPVDNKLSDVFTEFDFYNIDNWYNEKYPNMIKDIFSNHENKLDIIYKIRVTDKYKLKSS